MTPSPRTAGPALWRRIGARVPPPYVALLVFGLLLLGLRAAFGLPFRALLAITRGQLSVRYALVLMGLFALASLLGHARELWRREPGARGRALRAAWAMVRDWLPFIVCLWVYENLHDLTSMIRPDTVDSTLARADAAIFGVQPTLWLQRIQFPLLDDYMALAYMTYFLFPPLLAGWLYLRGHVTEFKEFQLGMVVAFYVGFLGYIAVPAVGPQLILRDQYTVPLKGWLFYYRIKQVVLRLQDFPRDCFPSMHTAISSVTLYFTWRHRRTLPWRRLILPPVIILTASLWFSTVYLRYHWFVDVVAGWGVTALACAVGVRLTRIWPTAERVIEEEPRKVGSQAG
jgi:membrane-associated phospholipid phosphatase